MKKLYFYSIHKEEGPVEARLHYGYTDGTYNYYRYNSLWFAIHPETGVAVVTTNSRHGAVETAHSTEAVEGLNKWLEQSGDEWKRTFDKLVAAAKEKAS